LRRKRGYIYSTRRGEEGMGGERRKRRRRRRRRRYYSTQISQK